MSATIALLSDFGTEDPYVAQMKGVILQASPSSRIIDLSHSLQPFALEQAGFFLKASHPHFPANTVFMAVVDPGVGGERKIICLRKHGKFFLAPDNGLLSFILDEPGPERIYCVNPGAYHKEQEIRPTFHGRDVFAPAAADLARTLSPKFLGSEISGDEIIRLSFSPTRIGSDKIECAALHIDRFGNIILNLPIEPWRSEFASRPFLSLQEPCARPLRLVRTYSDLEPGLAEEVGVLAGSQGFMELALNMKSAAALLEIRPGQQLTISCKTEP